MEQQEQDVKTALGMQAQDRVTGRRGTITGVAAYLHGTTRCQVEYIDSHNVNQCEWFDIGRLEIFSTD